eukprot:9468361-Alexandrium_andersonii.AAC.1
MDITPPFTSFNERLELQGQDCDAISISKNDSWDTRGNALVRVHRCLRQSRFAPFEIKGIPGPLQDLQPEHRAVIKDEAGRTLQSLLDADWRGSPCSQMPTTP